ncbi:protein TAPT1 homolog [Daktulosphaira vitifoliae]|uniref:protein TAPT1 homolog n=1 Tax=Daktulosphaira vitifoliae TaxID=58002 RepID=UPI0021AA4283|nr:protein TAPT1 homolog [Daktulosphaira vitifoliae]
MCNNMGKVESVTKTQSGSLWDFIRVEFSRGYSLEHDEKEYSDRREKVYTFMKIPLEVERFMFYGFCQCADSFLFVYTFLPLRALVALKSFICRSILKFRDKHKKKRLTSAEVCDLLKMAIIITCTLILMPWDTSMMYHVIKSQSVIKLYIFYNMLEVGDRLFSSFGQDILDALFWTATEPKHSRREHFGVLPHYVIAVIYVILHSILVLCQATTLNVAINSSHKALLAIMMSNNFVELKGSVFKKFDKTNLFQLSCSDVRERFHLFLLLLVVVVQTMKEYQWTSEYFWELMLDCTYVLVAEMLIDWTKHAFITRFNEINLSVYGDYVLSFAYDTAQSRHHKAFTDHSDLVARRMGFIPIPLGVVMIKVLTRCISIDGRLASILLLLFTFICLITLKIVNLIYILGRACKLIDFHKTFLIKNVHIKNGVSCQDMATSPMKPQLFKRKFWNENKENRPSPLIDVPPLGPIPMFANSNVDIKEACLNTEVLEDIMETDLIYSDPDLNKSLLRDIDTMSTKSA